MQEGETSVVRPPSGTTSDAFLLYYDRPDQPITFVSHSSEIPSGETVLTSAQALELGGALARIRDAFAQAYAPRSSGDGSWWAMDVEFKFDGDDGEAPRLYIKQARPYQ